MRRILLLSTSTVHGSGYMEYAVPFLDDFLGNNREILFVPYARPSGISHAEYARIFDERMRPAGYDTRSIHDADDPRQAVADARAVFIGGGNTFVLLNALYANNLLEPIRVRVAGGMPYLGSSAGSNVAGLTIGTSNDMPIVQPPSFEALALIPVNVNPHYLDPDPGSTHMGETRQTRIDEFHTVNRQAVVAMREGTMLRVEGDRATLEGDRGGVLFRAGETARELEAGTRLDDLLSD